MFLRFFLLGSEAMQCKGINNYLYTIWGVPYYFNYSTSAGAFIITYTSLGVPQYGNGI